MIITVDVDDGAMAGAVRHITKLLVHSVPGLCVADARDLAARYVREELEKHLAGGARDLLEDMALWGVLSGKPPAALIERACKAAQKIGGRR